MGIFNKKKKNKEIEYLPIPVRVKTRFELLAEGSIAIIESLLDTDLYKFTMQQAVFENFPKAHVKYSFKCRNKGVNLAHLCPAVNKQLDLLCELTFKKEELIYLGTIPFMKHGYLESLEGFHLHRRNIVADIDADGDLQITIDGNWYQTILFEVYVLAIVNELYFVHKYSDTYDALIVEGKKRLIAKANSLKQNLPVLIMEFGSRRRFSREFQNWVVEYLATYHRESLIGSSNVYLCMKHGLRAQGTMAHEWLQAFQAFGNLYDFQKNAFETWMQTYRGDLGYALSDVIGKKAFFRDFDKLFSKAYDGMRQDSGDPFEWAADAIEHYRKFKIDPNTKTLIFSNSLDFELMYKLAEFCYEKIRCVFGIGTFLTNDMGVEVLNIVIKAFEFNGRPVAKISDDAGKVMCKDNDFIVALARANNIDLEGIR